MIYPKTQRIVVLFILLTSMFITLSIVNSNTAINTVTSKIERGYESNTISYTEHGPIVITSNADFASQGWPGSGTFSDPYILEGLNITSNDNCISISDTNAFFVIRESLITGDSSSYGIYLNNVTNGQITGCNITGKSMGFYIKYSENNTISDNDINYNENGGIFLQQSTNFTIANNRIITGGLFIGPDTIEFTHHNIINNTVNGKPLGYFWETYNIDIDLSLYGQVILANCSNVTIHNGHIFNSTSPLQIFYTSNCIVDGVVVTSTTNFGYGILVYQIESLILTNVTVTGTDSGVYVLNGNNVTIVNSSFVSNGYSGCYFIEVENSTIANSTFSNNINFGLRLSNVDNTNVTNSIFDYNNQNGFDSYAYANSYFQDNIISHSGRYGLRSVTASNFTFLDNKVFSNGYAGLYFSSLHNLAIKNSNITDNRREGIYLATITSFDITGNILASNEQAGIYMTHSSAGTINSNKIMNNNGTGIDFNYQVNNLAIVNNTIASNKEYGIWVHDVCTSNTIYLNRIGWNDGGNARNSGTPSQWNSTNVGNYWSDYVVGTSNYSVPGDANGTDYFPMLLNDTTPPEIDHPTDVEYEEGCIGNIIRWTPYDAFPEKYNITKDGSLVSSGIWWGDYITINIDGLSAGNYTYTIMVQDTVGNTVTDSVEVIVHSSIPPTIDSPADLNYTEGETGNNIIWSPADDFPYRFEIYKNGSLIISDTWNGSQIGINVDDLSPGVYNYTLTVYDKAGNSASDSVIVIVYQTATSTTTSTSTTTTTTTPSTTGEPSFDVTPLIVAIIVGIMAVIIVALLISKRNNTT